MGDSKSFDSTLLRLESIAGDTRSTRKLRALGLIGKGEWEAAEEAWRGLVNEDLTDVESINNLAVSLLFQSKLTEAISLLASLLNSNKTAYDDETVLFNLATLRELRTEAALGLKVDVLRKVVMGGAEGLRAGCLKLG